MTNTSIVRPILYGLCGLVAYACDQWMNFEFMLGLEGQITSLVVAVPIAGLICCLAWPTMLRSTKRGDIANALMLCAVFVCLAAFSLGASVYRAGEAYDAKLAATNSANQPIEIAKRAVADAKANWRAKDQAVQLELSNGGCGPICAAKKEVAAEALKQVATAEQKLASLGIPKTADPLAARIAALLGIQESWVQTLYPLSLPIGIWLASVAFIGLAIKEITSGASAPVTTPAKKPAPSLSDQVKDWMQSQEQLDGKRPSQREAAVRFGVSPSTISRQLARAA